MQIIQVLRRIREIKWLSGLLILILVVIFASYFFSSYFRSPSALSPNSIVEETVFPNDSNNRYWWVDSGAYFYIRDGIGSTVQGALPQNDKWRLEYAATDPKDTDNGYHPQNLLRLITKSTWKNLRQEAYFRINDYRLSTSINRDEHNGILLFSRYVDGNNLYYAGIRVDGNVTIKKKINGEYYIMQLNRVLPGSYNRNNAPNLIPLNKWIGLKTVVEDDPDGTVSIRLYMDNGTGWTLVAQAVDDNKSFGGTALTQGSAGIRTDFMDVSVKGYEIEDI